MPLDFISVKQQIREIAKNAPAEAERINRLRSQARDLLAANADKGAALRARVEQAARLDSWLRSAKPTDEPLTSAHPLPKAPAQATVVAADGSQINPNRHQAVNYFLVNIGAITMLAGSGQPPNLRTDSYLHFAEYSASGTYSDDQVGLERDKGERVLLAQLAAAAKEQPVITLTDGPLELWGGRSRDPEEIASFEKNLNKYLEALEALHKTGAATAGYVDKPRADLVVRALEVAATPDTQLADIRKQRPLRGVTDNDLFAGILKPGERSAIFGLQTHLSDRYADSLALHFFYLNVGSEKAPWLARVEIPAWVMANSDSLNALHAVLMQQCGILAGRPYPYVLHRAHEIAIVSREEKEQLTNMLVGELQAQGVHVGSASHKQALKDLPGRTRR
ncbi:MAG: DNA double-strand break repair nuclease NurA [Chloroflexi bacterium]|nr:DNA double-strand break repair nuclease NurA [Chloroflexota bacterium]